VNRTFDPITLKLFVAVCEERNIARAAAREALVASAVSKRIGAIEQELGTPLLVRGRRGIEPTAAGQTLLRQAREVLAAMERMHAELSEFASGVQGSVRVVASVSALAEWLPEDIAAFLDRHQSARVNADERNSEVVVREVREGAADLGVVWDAVESPGLQRLRYRADHLGASPTRWTTRRSASRPAGSWTGRRGARPRCWGATSCSACRCLRWTRACASWPRAWGWPSCPSRPRPRRWRLRTW
jgi:DNA-binding transcriptional LysR family regulator